MTVQWYQKILTAQESSSLSLSMQGRAEFEQETSDFPLINASPPILFSSFTTIFGSIFFSSFSVHQQYQKEIILQFLAFYNPRTSNPFPKR